MNDKSHNKNSFFFKKSFQTIGKIIFLNYNIYKHGGSMEISEKIDSLRKRENLKYFDLAVLLGQHGIRKVPATIQNWCEGSSLPRADELLALSKIFKISVDEMLTNTGVN